MGEIDYSKMRQEFVIRGQTAVAARALHMVVETAAQGMLGDKVYSPLSATIVDRLIAPYSPQIQAKLGLSRDEVMTLLGINQPVKQVFAEAGGGFSAYDVFPDIVGVSASDAYVLYAPVGYDGAHFTPQDGQVVAASDRLGSGEISFIRDVGALAQPPVLMCLPENVTMPADFDEERHVWAQHPFIRPQVAG